MEPWKGHTHLGITMTTDMNWLSLKECFLLSSYIREVEEKCKVKDWGGSVGRTHKSGFYSL